MNKKTHLSIMSALLLSSAAAQAAPTNSDSVPDLEQKLENSRRVGANDKDTMGRLARAYFMSGQFEKGREMYQRIVTLEERGSTQPLELPNTLNSWGNSENDLARDFAAAERLHLKALALYDKLPKENKVVGYRLIIQFYKRSNHPAEAAKETQELAKIMGSSDPEVLFAPPACPACGMG